MRPYTVQYLDRSEWMTYSEHWFRAKALRTMALRAITMLAAPRWRILENGQPLFVMQLDRLAGDLDKALRDLDKTLRN